MSLSPFLLAAVMDMLAVGVQQESPCGREPGDVEVCSGEEEEESESDCDLWFGTDRKTEGRAGGGR